MNIDYGLRYSNCKFRKITIVYSEKQLNVCGRNNSFLKFQPVDMNVHHSASQK